MQGEPQDAHDDKVRRIIDIEKPFSAFLRAAFAVIRASSGTARKVNICSAPRIARAVAALGDKEPNYQRGDPTDDMKREHVPHRPGSRN